MLCGGGGTIPSFEIYIYVKYLLDHTTRLEHVHHGPGHHLEVLSRYLRVARWMRVSTAFCETQKSTNCQASF